MVSQVVAGAPSEQVTSQSFWLMPSQLTLQSPEHQTRQCERPLQSTRLPAPTRASQSVKLVQLTEQSSPQIAEHCFIPTQVRLQWLSQDVEQVSMFMQSSEQLSPQTLPQFFRLSQAW